MQHTFQSTFLCRCFARPTMWNFLVTCFMEEISYVFLFISFLLPPIFTLVAASISHFPKRRYKIFMLFFQQKNFPLYFISRSSCLSLFFSLSFASLACRLLSLFLCLSLYCKFVDMTSNLSQEPITRGRVTPILGLRHGVFTDQFIFRHILGHFFSRK